MLPLYGQDITECQWVGSVSNTSDARGDAFGKQAGFVFLKFLLLHLISPWVHACVGLTVQLLNDFNVRLFLFSVNCQNNVSF